LNMGKGVGFLVKSGLYEVCVLPKVMRFTWRVIRKNIVSWKSHPLNVVSSSMHKQDHTKMEDYSKASNLVLRCVFVLSDIKCFGWPTKRLAPSTFLLEIMCVCISGTTVLRFFWQGSQTLVLVMMKVMVQHFVSDTCS
jgi:hypothetical protein